MSEKKKLTQYELMMLASAYNIRNYCMSKECCYDCIFNTKTDFCVFTSIDHSLEPYSWILRNVGDMK